MAKRSGRQDCMLNFVQARFAVRNTGEEAAVKKLITNESIPTEMVEKCEQRGGLRYPDVTCWKFFSSIEYVFATIATTDNFIACGGSVLREISAALVSDNQVLSKYAELCDYKAASSFSSSDVTTCFQFCLLVFGRV